ncbi:MAG: YfhO family protein [Bacteroidetes bacterium]|jgi:hypothetical protein|nr:YfhO family protein [Bacteroidota bacterium]MBT6687477.1 YfhO family protein [Bacteroidota bacterium]MBT7142663.1 YfhO family protein [Bacteroidota bacterium]MBT7491068.1 YfhO family protein [Bacteroidota bacterium]
MKKSIIKPLLPFLISIIIFLLISVIYFNPILQGKRLKQGDIVNWQGAAQEIVEHRNETGEEPLWTNSMFGGMPSFQISTLYPSNLVKYVDRFVFRLNLPRPADYIFLYFIGFFIMLILLRVNPWLSFVGALAFAFSSYFFIIIEAGHNSKAHAIGYFAPVIGSIIYTYRGKYLLGGVLTALFLSLEIQTNHLQITYYLLLTVIIYGISELIFQIREKQIANFIKATFVLVAAALLAVGPNISNLLVTQEYGKYSTRGKSELTSDKENKTSGLDRDYVTGWSYGIAETGTFIIPNFMGGSSHEELSQKSATYNLLKQNNVPNAKKIIKQMPLYWGDQPFTSGPVYVGAFIFFFFVLGLFIVNGRYKWWILAATVLSLFLGWGHNFMAFTNFFLDYIPGYNKFRSVTMILIIAEFTIPLLAIFAIKELFELHKNKKELFKKIQLAFFISGGISFIFIVIPGVFFDFSGNNDSQLPDWLIDAFRSDRESALRMDALRSFFFITIAGLISWVIINKKLKTQYIYLIIIAAVMIDMVPIDWRYLDHSNFTSPKKVATPYQATQADVAILQDTDPNFRVFNLAVNTFNDGSCSYFHKSIGGYHGAKLKKYQELIEFQISKQNMSVLNMLNTKYFIVADKKTKQPTAQRNPGALGNAWFVQQIKFVANADKEMAALNDFNPSYMAIVDVRYKNQIQDFKPELDANATIKLTDYKPNYLVYESKTSSEQFAVFSEIYYDKGWNVYIDEAPAEYIRSNYLLRAMKIPEGNHKIEFKFEPKSYFIGEKIALISSLVLFLAVVAGLLFEIRKYLKSEEASVSNFK